MPRNPVTAPFTKAQIRHIEAWQENARFHPLTCPFHQGVKLDVRRDYLICPRKDCTHRQDWVPAVCADTPREPESEWP